MIFPHGGGVIFVGPGLWMWRIGVILVVTIVVYKFFKELYKGTR